MECLGQNEVIVFRADISWKRLLPMIPVIVLEFILAVLCLFVDDAGPYFLVLWACLIFTILWIGAIQFLENYFIDFVLTNKRIYGKTGVFSKNTLDTPLDKINNIYVQENIFGKIFGYGTIRVVTSSGEHQFKDIESPEQMKRLILNQIEQFREENMRKQAEEIACAMRK